MRLPNRLLAPLSLLLALAPSPVWSQQQMDAKVAGRILGPDRKPLADTVLRLRAMAGGAERTTRTDAEGRFRFEGVSAGEYRLLVERHGVTAGARTLRLAAIGQEVNTEIILPGEAGMVVEVEGTLAIATSVDLGKVHGSIREFPQSVVAIPASVLQETGSVRLDEGLSNVSAVTPSSSSNYGFLDDHLVRGMQVGYYRNGISGGTTYIGYIRSLWDAEQIEVLKGPGSALFGNGGPGGSINIVSRKPRFEPAYVFQVSGGSFGYKAGMFDATGAAGDSGAYRIIADATKSDGFRNLASQSRELLPSFNWRINSDQELLVQAEYRRMEQKPDSVGIPFHVSSVKDAGGNFPFLDPNLLAVPRETSYVTPFANSVNEMFRGTVTHTWTPSAGFTLRSVLSYGKRDLDFDRNFVTPNFTSATTLDNRYLRDQHDSYKDLTIDVEGTWRFRTGNVDHVFSTGLDIWKGDIDTNRRQSKLAPIADVYHPILPERQLADLNFAFIFDRSISIHREGLYLTDQVGLSDQWKLRLSVRRDHFKMDDDGTYNNAGNNSFSTTLDPNGESFTVKPITLAPGNLRTDEWFWNGQTGLVYTPIQATSFFGGISWGRLANITTEDPRSAFRPESNRQIELGNRTSLLDGNLSLSTAIYRTTRYNVPQSTLVGNDVVVTLIPKQETKGLDLDLSAKPLQGWFVLLASAWMDPLFVQTLPGDLTQGLTLTGVPRRTLRFWTSYELQEGALKGFGLGAGARGRSQVIFWNKVTPNAPAVPYLVPFILPSYTVFDVSAFYRRGPWEAQLSVKNFTDKTYWAYGVISSGIPGEARNLQLDLHYRF